LRHPTVRKRWDCTGTNSNLVIKHVRYTDIRETLAVTVDGVTSFDEESIKKASDLVKSRGGVWSW